ncbi:hypothetical protein [uncultured Tissierella sp.]|nr:hypothetical protein [uncultured Tissierella sp.]MDU5081271.1 hypothetical protein [Bacillota bacterium]
MSKNIDTTLAIKDLNNVYKLQKPNEGLILHSSLFQRKECKKI